MIGETGLKTMTQDIMTFRFKKLNEIIVNNKNFHKFFSHLLYFLISFFPKNGHYVLNKNHNKI